MSQAEASLQSIVHDFAEAMVAIDHDAPVWTSDRTGKVYQPGIGPHPETKTVELVAHRLAAERN
jgi:hypothetical protein